MAELIAFRSPGRSYDARPTGAGAQILFFTGVRYERMSDEAPPAPPKRRKPGRTPRRAEPGQTAG